MARSRFQAPRTLQSFEDVQRALREVQESLDAATASRAQLRLNTGDFALVAGAFQRVSAGTAGLTARLPTASGNNLSEPIILHLENMQGELTVFAAPGQTVNGQDTATFSEDGVIVLWSNGVDCWSGINQLPAESPSGAALGAEYVLGAAHTSLPNGRVATDSTEIDAVLTTPNVVSWALNTASVVLAKLQNLTGLSVLGRAATTTGVMAAITGTSARQILQVNSAATSLEFGDYVYQRFAVTLSTGVVDNYVLPTGMKAGDMLQVTITGDTNLRGIVSPYPGFWFQLALVNRTTQTARLIIENVTSSVAADAFATPGTESTAGGADSTAYDYILASEEEACILAHGTSGATDRWRIISGTSAQALTGAITAEAGKGGTRSTTFSGIRDNGTLETARGFLNFVNSTSNTLVGTQDSGNDEIEITVQRAALTGAITASANSNTTAFGALAAKSVLANATNASAVPAALAGSGAFQHLRVNSANTALEWAVLSLAEFPSMAAGTVLANVTAGAAVPTAHSLSTLAGAGLTYTNVTGIMAVGAGTGITVNADDVAVTTPLTDGDKGDITVSSNGTVFTVDQSTITPRKLAPHVYQLPAGTYDDLVIPDTVTTILTTGVVTINGIAGGWDGRTIDLIPGNGNNLITVAHAAGTSAVGNQITCAGAINYSEIRGGGRFTYDVQSGTDIWRFNCSSAARENPSEIQLSSLTGNMGTIDISALTCGGSVRATSAAASAAWSVEGFTAKTEGFWFHFSSETGVTNHCTLFNEDATATATNRLRLPASTDISSAGFLDGIFYYRDSRWSWISANPNQIAQNSTNYVRVSGGGVPQVNIATSTGDVTIAAGGEFTAAGDNISLDATNANGIVSITSASGAGGGALQITEQAASGATVNAGRGMLWVQNQAPSAPMFTDDTNVDREIATIGAPMTRGTAASFSTPFIIGFDRTSGTGGAGDTVLFNANLPFSVRFLAFGVVVSANTPGSTVEWRTATGGLGDVLSPAMSTATAGAHTVGGSWASTDTDLVLAAGSSVVIRWSDIDARAYTWALCVRT
jgi:hypothetical protein